MSELYQLLKRENSDISLCLQRVGRKKERGRFNPLISHFCVLGFRENDNINHRKQFTNNNIHSL